MDDREKSATRRQFLKSAGFGAAGLVAAGGGFTAAARGGGRRLEALPVKDAVNASGPELGLVATDGHITMPSYHRPVYIFGFVHTAITTDVAALSAQYKGKAQHPAPILGFRQYDPVLNPVDIKITLTNLGFVGRPDLTDSHTIHWHGFRAPVAAMDGVPEVSIAVPNQRQFTYLYRPHEPGTYMYHCHFEDVEHVQMGMTGVVFVRPVQNDKWVYNDASTAFHREFAILINEIWTVEHDNDEDIQESIHTDYDPNYFTLNGRVYPQTLQQSGVDGDPALASQPLSSLIQVNGAGASRYSPGGDVVLLRLANLGYQQHALQLPGIQMKVVGEDATFLRNPASGADLTYTTNTLYMGPGEARDVLLTAPPFSLDRAVFVADGSDGLTPPDTLGPFNKYFFKNASAWKLSNNGTPGPGGMMTEVRVYRDMLPAQSTPNQTYVAL